MQTNQELKKDIKERDAKIESQKKKIGDYKKSNEQHE